MITTLWLKEKSSSKTFCRYDEEKGAPSIGEFCQTPVNGKIIGWFQLYMASPGFRLEFDFYEEFREQYWKTSVKGRDETWQSQPPEV